MTKREMTDILDKLIECCVPLENQRVIKDLILNEEFHYIEPQHKTVFIDKMWNIGQAIREHQYIEIEYKKMKGKETVTRTLKPVAWCATRQVDKLNNENFFLPRYSLCTGLFMQRFLVFVHGIPVV